MSKIIDFIFGPNEAKKRRERQTEEARWDILDDDYWEEQVKYINNHIEEMTGYMSVLSKKYKDNPTPELRYQLDEKIIGNIENIMKSNIRRHKI